MADLYTPIFARNTLPTLSVNNSVPSTSTLTATPTNTNATTTPSGTNPYSNINASVSTDGLRSVSEQGATSLNPYITGLNDLANRSVSTSGSPNTSRASTIANISGIAARGVTSGDISSVSSLRPTNQYEQNIASGLSRLNDYSMGNSQVDRNIANLYLTRLDAAGAASSMAQAQRIASNPYLTTGAKQAALQETQRANASERSKMAGELAVKAQERAYEATKDYTNLSLDASKYEEEKYKTDLATATQNVKNNLDAAIASGNLESAEIQDNLSVWNTQISTAMQDLTRQTNALIQSGQLTQEQAALRMSGIQADINAQQTNVVNELNKARGIADYETSTANTAIAREESALKKQQLEATLAAQQLENYKTWNGLATSTILDYRTNNQGSALDDDDVALQNPMIQQALNNTWKNIPGNENTTMSEDWARAYYNNIKTSSESAAQVTQNKLNTLKTQWVDSGAISQEAFNNFTKQMQMVADFGGNVKMSADGKSVYMVGADGKPLTDNNGSTYSWDVGTGERSTLTTADSSTTVEQFNTWKTKNLLTSDVENYTDTQVYDAYNKLVSAGTTPTRDNILSSLKESLSTDSQQTNVAALKTSYDNILKNDPRSSELEDSGELTPTLWAKSGAKTLDEYVTWKSNYDKFGDVDTSGYTYTNTSSNVNELKDASGNIIQPDQYASLLKNANDPNSPNHALYQQMLDNTLGSYIQVGDRSKNTLKNVPPDGTIMNQDGRLIQVVRSGRFTSGGRDADTVVIRDLATGEERQFAGGATDLKAGTTINSLSAWLNEF